MWLAPMTLFWQPSLTYTVRLAITMARRAVFLEQAASAPMLFCIALFMLLFWAIVMAGHMGHIMTNPSDGTQI
jgi:hypothetical protein